MRIYILSAIVLLVLSFLLGSVIVDYCGLRKYGFRFTAPFGFFCYDRFIAGLLLPYSNNTRRFTADSFFHNVSFFPYCDAGNNKEK